MAHGVECNRRRKSHTATTPYSTKKSDVQPWRVDRPEQDS